MNEAETNALIERLVRRQEKSNEKILREIGRILGQIGELTPSEVYLIGQQLKYGESLQKIVKTIAETSRLNEIEIYKMLEHEAKTNLGFSKKYYEAKNVDFIPYEQNEPLKALVNQIATSTINQYRNIARTTGLTFLDSRKNKITKTLQEAYSDIIDDAINNVATGKQTFQQALTDQLKTIGKNGVQSIEYETGYHRRIDSALRMNLQDGLSYLFEAQQELMGSQFGANMVEVTHHENSAPDHIDTVDGKQFARIDIIKQQIANGEEKEIKLKDIQGNRVKVKGKWYDDFDTVNNSLKRKVSTLNCYHVSFSGILGIDEPRYSDKELKEDKEKNIKGFEYENKHYTLYEGQQLMRRIELELRKNKETQILARQAKDENLLLKEKNKSNKLIKKYHEIAKISGLKSKLERTRLLTKN